VGPVERGLQGINIKMVIKQLMTNLVLEDGFGWFDSVIRA